RDARGVAGTTIKRRRSSMAAIVQRAIEDFDLDIKNPFAKARLPAQAAASARDRQPLHTVHLELLDAYLETARLRADLRAIIGLLRYTGCRLGEVAGLD